MQPEWTERPRTALTTTVITSREARRAVLPRVTGDRADDVLLAVHELVSNALRVSASAEVASWVDDGRLVVEVTDHGPGLPDETAGYVPPSEGPAGGRGMWLAWSLADDAAIASDGGGTRIRLYFSS